MQREREILEGGRFFENFIPPPPPLERQLDSLCTITDQRTYVTHPHQNKKAQCLENENEAKSRCQRGGQKVRHGHAIGIRKMDK